LVELYNSTTIIIGICPTGSDPVKEVCIHDLKSIVDSILLLVVLLVVAHVQVQVVGDREILVQLLYYSMMIHNYSYHSFSRISFASGILLLLVLVHVVVVCSKHIFKLRARASI
jgi:hypothetical protein